MVTGEPPADPSSFLFLKGRATLKPADQPSSSPSLAQRSQHAPTQSGRKRHHQLAPSEGPIVSLQIKLISQLLMVSTRNISRSNANRPRMQDQPGDVESRLPGALETMQANTDEVEALRLTNQRLIGELE